jgi:hypothetical protein
MCDFCIAVSFISTALCRFEPDHPVFLQERKEYQRGGRMKGMTPEKSNESQIDLINRIECAIRHIQTATDVDPWAVEIAVEAMEKQIPKKPYTNVIHYPYTSDLTTVQCPNCKRRLRTRRTQAKGDRFCPDCGQAIDWEGEG